MDDQAKFLAEVAKVIAKTKGVLDFYKVFPEYPPSNLDFGPYIGALFAVCREQRKGFGGIGDLQEIHRVYEFFRTHDRDGRTAETITGGLASADRYRSWLNSTFPEVACGGSASN